MDRESEVARRVEPLAVALGDGDATLDELALALSSVLQPRLDVVGSLAALDELAAACPSPTRNAVMSSLFAPGAFVGDRERYHRWQNSCLDHVIASRRGMPITLAVVGVEVARRLGVELVGVGLPGHFLIGDPNDPDWFADPFHGRVGLDRDDCRTLLTRMGSTRWSDRFVEPVPNRLVIARMLNNLKASCERSGDAIRLALVMQARQLLPEFAGEHAQATTALAPLN